MRRLCGTDVRHRVAALALAGALVSGCAAMPGMGLSGGPELSSDEQALRASHDQLARTTLQGALAGAVLGGLVGLLAGQDASSAAIGAGIGALAGGAGGYYIGKRQQFYISEEARLQAMIGDVHADNERLREHIEVARRVIAEDTQRVAETAALYREKQLGEQEAKARLERVRENRALIAGTIETMRTRRDEYAYAAEQSRTRGAGPEVGAMDQQIAMLETQIATLEQELDSLDEALRVSELG